MTNSSLSSDASSGEQPQPLFPHAVETPLTIDVVHITHVRLSLFWRHSPLQWFKHAKAIFQTSRVTVNLTHVNHVLALPVVRHNYYTICVLTIISGLGGTFESLAERAYRVMDASFGPDISDVTTTTESEHRLTAIENAILANSCVVNYTRRIKTTTYAMGPNHVTVRSIFPLKITII